MPFCKKCGAKLEDSAAFCDICGTRVENKEAVINPASGQPVIKIKMPKTQIKKPVTTETKKETSKKSCKKRCLPLIIALCFGVLLLGVGIYVIVRVLDKHSKSEYVVPSDYYIEYPDAEEYFKENSKVLQVVSAKESTNVLSEKEVTKLLYERGFTQNSITTSFSMNGDYGDDKVISESSSEKHPMYQTYYVSSGNKTWSIVVIDGSIMAYPLTYTGNNPNGATVTVSETKEIVSYDFSSNSFYRNIPNENNITVRVVDRIDSNTLDSLNMEG